LIQFKPTAQDAPSYVGSLHPCEKCGKIISGDTRFCFDCMGSHGYGTPPFPDEDDEPGSEFISYQK
jgi:hypothetical protein